MTPSDHDLAFQLEQFVKEQASRFGDVISYVPAKTDVIPAATSESNNQLKTHSTAASQSVTHHGFDELLAKLSPYKGEAWVTAESLPVMQELIEGCQKCPLAATRNKLVFGVGNPQSKVLIIGEAPGADEDAKGEPFVGRAGKLLDKMLEAINFKREDIYIANILKSRPPNNRDPKPAEVEACEPYLWKQILILKPSLILCLGRVAGTNLLKMNEALGKMRGQVFDFYGIKAMVTYHPAALLRNPDWKHGAWEDLKQFRRLYDNL